MGSDLTDRSGRERTHKAAPHDPHPSDRECQIIMLRPRQDRQEPVASLRCLGDDWPFLRLRTYRQH